MSLYKHYDLIESVLITIKVQANTTLAAATSNSVVLPVCYVNNGAL
jgi:hypothetical protein